MAGDLSRRDLIRAGGTGAAGLALLGAGGCNSSEPAVRRPRRAKAPAGAMNVVVVVLDSLRADHVYGSRARTPTLDALARESLRFRRAYPEGMPTIPARRAIMEGHRTFPFRGWRPYKGLPPQPGWEPIGHDRRMWTDHLRRAGWTAGYVTDNPHILASAHDRFRKRFDRVELVAGQVPLRRRRRRHVPRAELYRHLPPALRGTRAEPRLLEYLRANPRGRSEDEYLAARVFADAMAWLEWVRARQPFALVVDSFDAHEPWDAPRRLVDLYGRPSAEGVEPIQPFPTPSGRTAELDLSRRLVKRMAQLYAAEVTLVDRWFGRLLDRLAGLGLAENTLVVAISDHGVLLGEYGWVGKRYSELHDELTHVPFLIRHPQGKAKNRTSDYFASTHDVGPTVLSVLGLEPPDSMDGVDLSPLLDGRRPPRRRHRTASYTDHVCAADGRWLLIADNHGRDKRLYRLGRERRDLARSHPKQVRRLWRLVLKDAGNKPLPRFKVGGE